MVIKSNFEEETSARAGLNLGFLISDTGSWTPYHNTTTAEVRVSS
jgi:hypothetical protein